ncbi:MAG: protein phosphatase domain protein [Nocardioides sp.]|nr:protein phosphatase domain protein [Nocardioides sp.]
MTDSPAPLDPQGSSPAGLHLQYAATSDVGRVRKDNQDSGYAGPWLLAVCDGVGGAARGDIASATAIQQLRRLDESPDNVPGTGDPGHDLLARIAGAVHRAHDRIVELVEEDPALSGTSTTATLTLFDGSRIGVGHVGDSRAYLFRGGEITQLTSDHTFVQSLIDEGRITEEESRVHPHRNLILRAIDGVSDSEPDLFVIELAVGDRLLLCSDGASGVLDDGRLADILATGGPDFAAVELVRASLEAGSSDNVTCIVADVLDAAPAEESEPVVVGAAAERRLPRQRAGGGMGGLFRGHRAGDTGELEPITADLPDGAITNDPIDPEQARYAPRPPRRFVWLKRLCALVALVGVLWLVLAAAWSWSQDQYFVGEDGGAVVIFRGVNAELPGVSLNTLFETSDVQVDRLSEIEADRVREGIAYDNIEDAEAKVQDLAARQASEESPADG